MVALALRTAIVLTSLLAVAASGQDAFDRGRQPMATVQRIPAPEDGSIAATIAQWHALQQTDALPFDSYASFLTAHPGWPGEAGFRRAAERQAVAGTGSAGNVAAYFRRFAPTTGAGNLANARALAATGSPVTAAAAARKAWRSASLSASDESYVLTAFPGALTSEDHDARMDALLWAGQTGAAARVLPLTSPARQPLFAARLALRSSAPDAPSIAAANAYAGDAGFVADRAAFLKNSGQWDAARTALASAHRFTTPPGNAAVWLDTLWSNARAAAADRQWQLAYDIGRQVDDVYSIGTDVGAQSYAERDDYTNLAWTAGRAALKQLARPADAMTLFDRYARASHSPPIKAKGFYWAGRAAEAAGNSIGAMAYLTQAAGYRDQYYGQLAAERVGRALTAPPAIGPTTGVDPAVRAAFYARETVRAARFLGPIGQYEDQTLFLRQIAMDAKSDTDHLLAAELSRQLNRPDLSVMVGRSALVNGLSDYSLAGFPTMPVPAGYEGSWTIIHAISRQESQFDRAAVSHAGARGLMQLMPGTAREQSGKIGVAYSQASLTSDPQFSMMLGSSFFARLFNQYGSYPLAIAAYNAGPGNVNRWLAANGDPRQGADVVDWIEAIPISETRGYVQRVLENAVVYDLMNPQRALSGGRAAPMSWYLGKARPG
ncbi:lytic transglycosylase domain-containing protein [Sphingomonas bacterium]|uniref:lytic transglycosylase domain-containing protein n=1 Tax=Sphingomonas bacterium TaxID=1895847 RepID=UPI001576FD6B|nr:lytic transglycosylase domain-containing protein [Sphingomonas bacterium]